MLFDKEGNQVPQQIVIEVGEAFKKILKEVAILVWKFYMNFTFSLCCFWWTYSLYRLKRWGMKIIKMVKRQWRKVNFTHIFI